MTADEELEARLENWGRWAFEGSNAKRRSMPLFCLIDRGEDAGESGRDIAAVDVEDALRVQAAWSSLPATSHEERGAKLLLGLTYCSDCPRSTIFRKMRKMYHVRIDPRNADDLLSVAKKEIRKRLLDFTKI